MMKPGDGRLVGTRPMADCRISVLSHMMLGRPLTEMFPPKRNTPGQTLLKVEGLSRPGMFHDITFELRAGEILGIAGLVGSGRTEIGRAVFGAERAAGRCTLEGRVFAHRSPRRAKGGGYIYQSDHSVASDVSGQT